MKKVNYVFVVIALLSHVAAFAQTYNVENFGAVANDGVDDFQAITDAIAAASTGDTVQLGAGIYHVSDTIEGKSGVLLQGAGKLQTTLSNLPNAPDHEAVVRINDVADMVVSRMTLDGNNAANVHYGVMAYHGPGGNTLRDLRITHLSTPDSDDVGPEGIHIVDQANSSILDNDFINIRSTAGAGAGIGLYGGPYVISGNHIDDVGRNGIYGLRCRVDIRNNTVDHSGTGAQPGDTGISIELHPGDGEGGCVDSLVEHNTVDSWISVVGAGQTAIRYNNIGHHRSDERYAGIEVSGENMIVAENDIDDGVHFGMIVERPASKLFIRRNRIAHVDTEGMGVVGVRPEQDAAGTIEEKIYFEGNTVDATDASPPNEVTSTPFGSGITINRNSFSIDLDNNRIINNGGDGIAFFSEPGDSGPDQVSLVYNDILNNAGTAISQNGSPGFQGGDLEWEGNVIASNGIDNLLSSIGFANNQRPWIGLLAPTTVVVGQQINFAVEYLDDGPVANMLWDFGDGVPVMQQSPSHVYTKPGTYNVGVIAWDSQGRAGHSNMEITVTASQGGGPTDIVLQEGLNGYQGSEDSHIYIFHHTTNFGSRTELRDKDGWYRMLVYLPIFQSEGGPVPDGATIESATLSLYKSGPYNHDYEAHRLLREWHQSDVTWDESQPGVAWSVAGARGVNTDIVATADGQGSVGFSAQWLDIDVTGGVRQMSSGGSANHGWLIEGVSGNNNKKTFVSSESTDSALRPKLLIRYSVGGASANEPPIAKADTASVPSGQAVAIDVLSNDSDPDGDALLIAAVTQPRNGRVVVNAGRVDYVSTSGFLGLDSFVYYVIDSQGHSVASDVRVSVTGQPRGGGDHRYPRAPPAASYHPSHAAVIDVVETYAVLSEQNSAGQMPGLTSEAMRAAYNTARINQAIQENINNGGGFPNRVVYFPSGTYLVDDRLAAFEPTSSCNNGNNCWRSGLQIRGQDRDNTIIRLIDHADGYADANSPRALIYTASNLFVESPNSSRNYPDLGEGNEAFDNYIENLTIDTGDNPGAIGIDYLANNRGAIRDVRVRGNGYAGIGMERKWVGPALLSRVQIEGFRHGIRLSEPQYSLTAEDISLLNQTQAGILNRDSSLFLRKLTSINNVPAIENTGIGFTVLLDGMLSSGSPNNSAVRQIGAEGALLVRNTLSRGYRSTIEFNGLAVPGAYIDEYVSHEPIALSDATRRTLNLPVEETPFYHDNDLGNWVNVRDKGAFGDCFIDGITDEESCDDYDDDTVAIQAALDSGEATVYLPSGRYYISETLNVPAHVRRIVGFEAVIAPLDATVFSQGEKAVFLVAENSVDPLIIEHVHFADLNPSPDAVIVEHLSRRAAVIKDAEFSGAYQNAYLSGPGAGDLFIENVSATRWVFGPGQSVWARQLNPEFNAETGGNGVAILNSGAKLWVLGLKSEGAGTLVKTVNGGYTEVLGAFVAPYTTVLPGSPDIAFINEESQFTASYVTQSYAPEQDYVDHVMELRGGSENNLTRASPLLQDRPGTTGKMAPLVSGAEAVVLGNHFVVSGTGWNTGDRPAYSIEVPEGVGRLSIRLSVSGGDPDLYVKRGSLPVVASNQFDPVTGDKNWDCRPFLGNGGDEPCDMDNPQGGQWYAVVDVLTPVSNAYLTGDYPLSANH